MRANQEASDRPLTAFLRTFLGLGCQKFKLKTISPCRRYSNVVIMAIIISKTSKPMKIPNKPSLEPQRYDGSCGFSFIEAIFTIAIIGIMASLVVSAISNASRDAHRVIARQQQGVVQEALTSWVMAQTRVGATAQIRSLDNVRTNYNLLGTSSARFNLLVPNPASSDPNARAGYIDQITADHILDYTGASTDKLKTAALENSKQYLTLGTWQSGDFPRVDLVVEP